MNDADLHHDVSITDIERAIHPNASQGESDGTVELTAPFSGAVVTDAITTVLEICERTMFGIGLSQAHFNFVSVSPMSISSIHRFQLFMLTV